MYNPSIHAIYNSLIVLPFSRLSFFTGPGNRDLEVFCLDWDINGRTTIGL
jgi:hypothetical protein